MFDGVLGCHVAIELVLVLDYLHDSFLDRVLRKIVESEENRPNVSILNHC